MSQQKRLTLTERNGDRFIFLTSPPAAHVDMRFHSLYDLSDLYMRGAFYEDPHQRSPTEAPVTR